MEELAAALGGTVDGDQLRFSAHGVEWTLRHRVFTRHSILTLTVPSRPLPQLTLRKKRWWLSIDSAFPESRVRKVVKPIAGPARALFPLGVNLIAIRRDQIAFTSLDAQPELEKLRAILVAANRLREALPELPPEMATGPVGTKAAQWTSWVSGPLFPPVATMILYFVGPRWMTVERWPLLYAMVAGLGFALLTEPLRRWLHRYEDWFTSRMNQWTWILGHAMLFICLALTVNGAGDRSPTVEHRVAMHERRYTRVTDQARVDYWRGGTVWVPISHDLYARVMPGDRLRVVTQAGRLGFEWVREVAGD